MAILHVDDIVELMWRWCIVNRCCECWMVNRTHQWSQ